ncbi:60S ribosomal protein L35 [Nemania serpens]|nr:60S ribosomal protein L35 [Nemania serpens]
MFEFGEISRHDYLPLNDDDDDDDPETANSTRQTPYNMSTSKVKTGQLWNKSKDDLVKQLGELKAELGQLRIQKITSSGSKLNKMYVQRRYKHHTMPLDIRLTNPNTNVGADSISVESLISFFSSYSHDLRKSIARILTVVNLKQRQQLRLFYKNKKYLPLELRPKQTRAIRRRLSPEEKSKVLEKTKKRTTHFPQRKYAVKAA